MKIRFALLNLMINLKTWVENRTYYYCIIILLGSDRTGFSLSEPQEKLS